jgi:hypothetical protein
MFVVLLAVADCRFLPLRLIRGLPDPCTDIAPKVEEYCADGRLTNCGWGDWTCTASYV